MFDAFAWPDQAKGEQHISPLHTKLGFKSARLREWHIRDAVLDDIDLRYGHAVGFG
ncbi:MAG: hypothetical protein R3F19_30390 [Verrucomicrobiales bacterium]